MANSLQNKSEDLGKLLIRIAVGGIMLFHGVFKLTHGVDWIKQMLGGLGVPGFFAYGTYVAEIMAPILILLGFRTRLAALLVTFDMLVAIGLVLRQQIFAVKEMGGGWAIEVEAFFLLASLALFFTGAGKYSVTKAQNPLD